MSYVLIDGKNINVRQQNSDFVQSLLKNVHLRGGDPRPRCLCRNQSDSLELYVCKRGFYFLKRMPNTGQKHHPSCVFYSPVEQHSGLQGYAHGALVVDDQKISIKANLTISKSNPVKSELERSYRRNEKHARQNKLTIGGIFSVLWEQSEINVWKPQFNSHRSWGAVYNRLQETINITSINRVKLSSTLFLPSPVWSQNDELFSSFLGTICRNNKYGLILGELVNVITCKNGNFGLKINRLRQLLFVTGSLFEKTRKSYNKILNVLNDSSEEDVRVFGLFYLESYCKSNNTWGYRIHQVFLFRTTGHYIPVDSGYEHEVVNKLVIENRSFVKPLRYDADKYAYFPDFILTDTGGQETLCEVWGMADQPDYLEHMKEKKAYYQSQNLPLWEWDTSISDVIPSLPSKQT